MVFERWIAPRLPRAEHRGRRRQPSPPPTVRAQDALAAAILVVASFAFVLGIGLVGWLLALGEAVVAIIAATTRVHLGDRFRRLF